MALIPVRPNGDTASLYSRESVSPMPAPGDPYAGAFVAEVGQCWRMIHDRQGQATHWQGDAHLDWPLARPERRKVVESVGVSCSP